MIEFTISTETLDLVCRAICCGLVMFLMVMLGCMGYAVYGRPKTSQSEKVAILIVIIGACLVGITSVLLVSGIISFAVV
jgi:hypothetical protein